MSARPFDSDAEARRVLDDFARSLKGKSGLERDLLITDRATALEGILDEPLAEVLAAVARVGSNGPQPAETVDPVTGEVGAADKPDRHARMLKMADVAAEDVTWLWPGRIPQAKITLLIGDPGMGKTMLALDIAARVSRGTAFPDGSRGPAGDVIFMTAEDGLADTIRPRLDAAGADVSRIWALTSVMCKDKPERLFSMADDVDVLERVVVARKAVLVMIDPLDGYLKGTDSHKNAEVRAVLAPLASMLERTGAAGLLNHHLNKDASTVSAMYRAGGSLAFVAAARAVFGVAPDPDSDNEGRRLFLPVKLNIAKHPPGIGYRIGDRGIEWDTKPVTCDAAAAFGPAKRANSDKVAAATEFLSEALAAGTPVAQLLIDDDAQKRGISKRSLQTAKVALGVQSKRDGFGRGGVWYWTLPIDTALRLQEG